MKRLVATLLLAATTGCTTMVNYERGMPKRVEAEKVVGPQVQKLFVAAIEPGTLELAVYSARRALVARTLVYHSVQERYEYGEWYGEFAEIPLGLLILPMWVVVCFAAPPEDVATKDWDQAGQMTGCAFGMVNPAQSLLTTDVVRDYQVEDERFTSGPIVTDFEVAVPYPQVPLDYVVTDAAGAVVKRGEGTTDGFGRVLVEDLPLEASKIVFRTAETTITADIHWPPPDPDAPAEGDGEADAVGEDGAETEEGS